MEFSERQVLGYWYGSWPFDAAQAENQKKIWFKSTQQMDEEIAHLFGDYIEHYLQKNLTQRDIDKLTLDKQLAIILLLDQFTRNVYRKQARAFAGDSQALAITQTILRAGAHRQLPLWPAVFACMPLQHSESSAIQELSEQTFKELWQLHGDNAKSFYDYALKHKAIIDRFGRYPHRNAALGRNNTPAEDDYLLDAQTFGQ